MLFLLEHDSFEKLFVFGVVCCWLEEFLFYVLEVYLLDQMFLDFWELSPWKVRILGQHLQSDVVAKIVIEINLILWIFDENVKLLEIQLLGIGSQISCSRDKWMWFFGLDFVWSFWSYLKRVVGGSVWSSGMIRCFKGRVESFSVFLWGGIGDISGFGEIQLSILILKDGMVFWTKRELMIGFGFGFEGIGVGKGL